MTAKHNLPWFHGVIVNTLTALRTGASRLRWQVAKPLRSTAAALVSPELMIVVLVLAGTGLGVAGVFIMWGHGLAMLAGCGFAFMLAALISRGAGNA